MLPTSAMTSSISAVNRSFSAVKSYRTSAFCFISGKVRRFFGKFHGFRESTKRRRRLPNKRPMSLLKRLAFFLPKQKTTNSLQCRSIWSTSITPHRPFESGVSVAMSAICASRLGVGVGSMYQIYRSCRKIKKGSLNLPLAMASPFFLVT